MLAQLLVFELFATVFLDTANELLGILGAPLVLGQVVRAFFIFLNLFAIFEFGKRMESQVIVLIYLFFALMVFREVYLGIGGMSYAATYWAKFLLYVSTFYAIKCAGSAGALKVETVETFFRWSVVFIAPAFLFMVMVGLLDQRAVDSGYEGEILSKNSTSATLLILFATSLFLALRKRVSFFWVIVIAVTLTLLGSKSTIVFGATMVIACVFNELRSLAPRSLLLLGLMAIGICAAIWIYRDAVGMVVESQLQRYQYVTERGGSFMDYLLTGRNDLLGAAAASFLDRMTPLSLMVGNGIAALSFDVADIVNAAGMYRGVEMDFFELAFASGVIGLTITLIPFAMSLKALMRIEFEHSFYLGLGVLVAGCFMAFGGHVVTEGMPAAYLGVYLAYICLLRGRADEGRSPVLMHEVEKEGGAE